MKLNKIVITPDIDRATVEELFIWFSSSQRDIVAHAQQLKTISSLCEHVTEISNRSESLIFLCAGKPKKVISYNKEKHHPSIEILKASLEREQVTRLSFGTTFEETDALFLDTEASYEILSEELKTFADRIRKFIIIHGTMTFGEIGEKEKLGMNYALREFVSLHSEWRVYFFSKEGHGLTVLTKDPAYYPLFPVKAWSDHIGKPGTELTRLLKSLGIKPKEGCSCLKVASQMDFDGVDKCRERREDYLQQLKNNAAHYGWSDFIKAGFKSLISGLAFQITATDPLSSLFDLALSKAEENEFAAKRSRT
jgi:hypothetical protein